MNTLKQKVEKLLDKAIVDAPFSFRENLAFQILSLFSQSQAEQVKAVEEMPKFDLSKNGIDGEFYLKREEVLSILTKKK